MNCPSSLSSGTVVLHCGLLLLSIVCSTPHYKVDYREFMFHSHLHLHHNSIQKLNKYDVTVTYILNLLAIFFHIYVNNIYTI